MAAEALCCLLDASEQKPAEVELRLQLLRRCRQQLQSITVNVGSNSEDRHDSTLPIDVSTGEDSTAPTPEISQDLMWQALVQQQYLLSMDLLMSPEPTHHSAADELISQLRQTWRLADAVWAACNPSELQSEQMDAHSCFRNVASNTLSVPAAAAESCHHTKYLAPASGAEHSGSKMESGSFWSTPLTINCSHTLPPATLSAVQHAFRPESCYWSEHSYSDPSTPFWSYTYDLRQPASNIVELACQQLRSRLELAAGTTAPGPCPTSPSGDGNHCQLRGLQEAIAQATHVEWWAHTRAPGAAHQLHFDCDETRLRKGREAYHLTHPVVSSVLFLTSHGGPTLVLDQAPGAAHLAERAWLAHPTAGTLLAFPGHLLHGVLPQVPGVRDAGGTRTTLVLAWWCRGTAPTAAACSSSVHVASTEEAASTHEHQGDHTPEPWSAGALRPQMHVPSLTPPPSKRHKAAGAIDLCPHKNPAAPTPAWVQLFSQLAEPQLLSAAAAPEAIRNPHHDLEWQLIKPVAPAWLQVQSREPADASAVPTAALAALPDLRLLIPHEHYFTQLYPVQ